MSVQQKELSAWLADACRPHLVLNETQLGQLARYLELLLQWNERMNLTAITEPRDVYVKHFYDSLTPVFVCDFGGAQRLIDVGTGAGFPGIPLKIAFPHLRLTLLDSLQKRLAFLKAVVEELALRDVELVHGRAEEIGRDAAHREQYDVAVARAVARLNVLAEYCLPFVRLQGVFLAMKGGQVAEEVREAARAVRRLGGGAVQTFSFSLPDGAGERTLCTVKKERSTPPDYPRGPGVPTKKPLL